MPGAGLLNFREDRALTLENCSKATWIKRDIYDVKSIFGNRKNSSKKLEGLYYAGNWQDLGLFETEECKNWAKNLLE